MENLKDDPMTEMSINGAVIDDKDIYSSWMFTLLNEDIGEGACENPFKFWMLQVLTGLNEPL